MLTEGDRKESFFEIISNSVTTFPSLSRLVSIHPNTLEKFQWVSVDYADIVTPEQGWKLHVSAAIYSARSVLLRVLPMLLQRRVSFKVVASMKALEFLNEGHGGLSQVGKFITIYPTSDTEAITLGTDLHEATYGFRGPKILSDKALCTGSLVHYRYGSFGSSSIQTPLGEIVSVIRTPTGELVPDVRSTEFSPPTWAQDPFEPRAAKPALVRRVLVDRYLPLFTIDESARGSVEIAIDLRIPRRCILKRARRDAVMGMDGSDATDLLKNELSVLGRLGNDRRIPQIFDSFTYDGDFYLVMDDMEGETLEEHIMWLAAIGRRPSDEEILKYGRALASILTFLHAHGLIHRDLKPSNIICAADGTVRLLDFGISHWSESQTEPLGLGTHGYMSPQQASQASPSVSDDIFALGAVLYFVATGTSLLDRPGISDQTRMRSLRVLNPYVKSELIQLIGRCLDPKVERRFTSATHVSEALNAFSDAEPNTEADLDAPIQALDPVDRSLYQTLARRLADTICHEAVPDSDGTTVYWKSAHEVNHGALSHDINIGNAGVVLSLAELTCIFKQPEYRGFLEKGVRGLLSDRTLGPRRLPGLYVGEAGVGAAILRAGQVLGSRALIAAAVSKGNLVASLPHESPDLFNGTAGRLRFHLLLWDEVGDQECLNHAIAAGNHLLAVSTVSSDGKRFWTIPPGFGGLSGDAYLGYAHGAAGIADSLLDLWEVCGDKRFLEAAKGASNWLQSLAVTTLDDNSGFDWPDVQSGTCEGAFWCHGGAGIGTFFNHAAKHPTEFPVAAEISFRAARNVAFGTWWQGPTRCHGLAGGIELLLDMYKDRQDAKYLKSADYLAEILIESATERNGLLYWPSESTDIITPDYMVGYCGVAVCLLRLAYPGLPTQISRAGFRLRR